jgi:hypothetical protein
VHSRAAGLLAVASVIASLLLLGGSARADDASALLYDYSLAGVASSSVPNRAPDGPAIPMTLAGSWRPTADGVYFAGDTMGHQSIGYALPAAGTETLNAGAAQAVGVGTRFAYKPPTTDACFSDSPNLTQIGRFRANRAQAKLQLSKCDDSETAVFVQCRFAGSHTPSTVGPVTSSMRLVAGDTYVIRCIKSPDNAGTATVSLSVTAIDPTGHTRTQVDDFSVEALGVMKSTRAVSVANKYPLPATTNNTDQFVGVLGQATYCVGTTADVTACLASYLPAS